MFEAWGRFVYRRRRLVLLVAAMVVAGAAVWGTGVFGGCSPAGASPPPAARASRRATLATRAFGRDTADVVVLYRSPSLTVRDPAYRAAVTAEPGGPADGQGPLLSDVLVHRVAAIRRARRS